MNLFLLKQKISESELEELTLSEKAFTIYRQQNWQQAKQLFEDLKQLSPDRLLYNIYLERIASFMEDPPEKDWDGVFTHKTK